MKIHDCIRKGLLVTYLPVNYSFKVTHPVNLSQAYRFPRAKFLQTTQKLYHWHNKIFSLSLCNLH